MSFLKWHQITRILTLGLFTWLKKQSIEDAFIQPYSGHESRQSLEIYSKLSIGEAQKEYENVIGKFPV